MPKKEKKHKKEKKERKEKREKKARKEKLAKRKHPGGSNSDTSDSKSEKKERRMSVSEDMRLRAKGHKEDTHKKQERKRNHGSEKNKRKRDDDNDSGSSSSSTGGDNGVQRSVITGRKLKLQRDDKSDADDARRAAIRAQMNEGETFEWSGSAKDSKPQSAYERRVAALKADPAQINALMRKKAEQARLDLAVGFGNKELAGRGGYFTDRGRTV